MRTAEGVEVNLDAAERAILHRIPDLIGSVGAAADDPAGLRLDPMVFPEDPEASREFSRLAGSDVAAGRQSDATTFAATLAAAEGSRADLTMEEVEACVRALGTARLTLAARNPTIVDDESFSAASRSQPDVALIDYLGLLQEELVAVLLDDLPESK